MRRPYGAAGRRRGSIGRRPPESAPDGESSVDAPRQDADTFGGLACIGCHHPAGPRVLGNRTGESGCRFDGLGFVRANPVQPSKADCRMGGPGFVRAKLASAHGCIPAHLLCQWSDHWVRLLDFPSGGPLFPRAMSKVVRPVGSFALFSVSPFRLPGGKGSSRWVRLLHFRCGEPTFPARSINFVEPVGSFAQPDEMWSGPSPGDRPGMI